MTRNYKHSAIEFKHPTNSFYSLPLLTDFQRTINAMSCDKKDLVFEIDGRYLKEECYGSCNSAK